MPNYKNPRHLVPDLPRPDRENWIVGDAFVNTSNVKKWSCTCKLCGKVSSFTLKQLHCDELRCRKCQGQANAIMLTALGKTMALSAWVALYPDRINAASVRQYVTNRKYGRHPYCDYTDEQILFGPRLQRHPDPVKVAAETDNPNLLFSYQQKANALQESIHATIVKVSEVMRQALIDEFVPKFLSQAMLVSALNKDARVAGHDYMIQSAGITIGQLLEVDTPIPDIAAMLEGERFSSYEAKQQALSGILPLAPGKVSDHSNKPQSLTEIEIMALLSRYARFI